MQFKGRRVTGVSVWGIQWEPTDGDNEIARRVLNLLDARQLIWGVRSWEDERYCVESAIELRHELTQELNTRGISPSMAQAIRSMQRALIDFVQKAGNEGGNFSMSALGGQQNFFVALGSLRTQLGIWIGLLSQDFSLEISTELTAVVADSDAFKFEKLD